MPDKAELQMIVLDKRVGGLERALDAVQKESRQSNATVQGLPPKLTELEKENKKHDELAAAYAAKSLAGHKWMDAFSQSYGAWKKQVEKDAADAQRDAAQLAVKTQKIEVAVAQLARNEARLHSLPRTLMRWRTT